jgi:DNA mismatch repair protein MutL
MPVHLSNKIAAGEVVDRPASVVKELVENSIDSDADQITIEITDSGRGLIKVIDNGKGIHEDDIPLIFERHATSKVYDEKDIDAIFTLGFRGEALASIASVSKVTLLTRNYMAKTGFKLQMVEGNPIAQEKISMTQGTTLSVMDLFFNAPARFKFLKSRQAETKAINQIVHHLAIANPSIKFKYIVDGQIKTMTSGDGEIFSVLYQIYGREMIDHMVKFTHKFDQITFEGYITDLNYYRGNRSLQSLYVNNRYIQNSAILEAINQAYKSLIPIHQFPAFFIKMTIDPKAVDVNIHPNKLLIRIDHEDQIADMLSVELRKGLYQKETHVKYQAQVEQSNVVKGVKSPVAKPNVIQVVKPSIEKSNVVDSVVRQTVAPVASYDNFVRSEKFQEPEQLKETIQEELIMRSDEVLHSKAEIYENLKFVGQVMNSYLIFEKNSSVYYLDQHAAHEKILYEQFMAAYRNSRFDSQIMIAPEIVSLSNADIDSFKERVDVFRKLGFELEIFGENELIFRGIPTLFTLRQAKDMFNCIIDQITSNHGRYDKLLEDSIIQQSCKHAIKAHDKLQAIESVKLIDQLKELKDPMTCPHGRPIIIEMSRENLDKLFKRI